MIKTFIISIIVVFIGQFGYSQKNVKPIISAKNFSNSTELWESIGIGVINYQADVVYIYGKLFVSEMMPDSANHTLSTLSDAYLYPLYSQYRKNKGEIIPGYVDDIFLILNFNSHPIQIFKQLSIEMRPYLEMFEIKTSEAETKGKIRILIKDAQQFEKINSIKPGIIGLVGNLSDIDKNVDSEKMPLIEVEFNEITDWKGTGNIPFEEFKKIKEIVAKVHLKKKKFNIRNFPKNK